MRKQEQNELTVALILPLPSAALGHFIGLLSVVSLSLLGYMES